MAAVLYKTKYPYDGNGATQDMKTLSFQPGEMVNVICTANSGWWEGEKDGQRGWFPASYVEQQPSDVTHGDWQEVTSDQGELYYVNTKTLETSWELPKPDISAANTTSNNMNGANTSPKVNGANTMSNNAKAKDGLELDLKHTISPQDSPKLQKASPGRSAKSLHGTTVTSSHPSSPATSNRSKSMRTPDRTSQGRSQASTPTSSRGFPQNGVSSPVRMLNGISYPDEAEAKEQPLLQPGKFSYCDYFWGERNENTGFQVLYQKMLKEKQICKEMADLFKQREQLELQYAKGLTSIANSILAMDEEGTVGDAWREVKESSQREAIIHQEFAQKLRTEVEKPLLDQKEHKRKEMKKVEAGIASFRKQVDLKYQAVERSQQALNERTKELDLRRSSPKHTKDDVQKARMKRNKKGEELTQAVEQYNNTRQSWFEEVVTSSLTMENHEAERIEEVKKLLERYVQLRDECTDKTMQTSSEAKERIEKVSSDKDRELWVRKNATGRVRPVDLVL